MDEAWTDAILTEHARGRLALRKISEETIREVLAAPEQVADVRPGRVVAQAMVGGYLIRVFIDVDRDPAEVVTAYRTRKTRKFGSQS